MARYVIEARCNIREVQILAYYLRLKAWMLGQEHFTRSDRDASSYATSWPLRGISCDYFALKRSADILSLD